MKDAALPKRLFDAGRIVFLLALLLPPALLAAGAKDDEEAWRAREALLARLSAEWFNIGRLHAELSDIDDMLQDIKIMELYPVEVTRLTDNELVEFDRAIERSDKQRRAIVQRVNTLKPGLTDAIEILRELVIGQPVKEMFAVIEAGSIERLSEMIRIRHCIDSAWQDVNGLLDFAAGRMEVSLQPDTLRAARGFEEDFFAIVRANAGVSSQPHYEKLGRIKDSLIARATPPLLDAMYVTEVHYIRDCLTKKKSRTAMRKSLDLRNHFNSQSNRGEISELVSQAYFLQGQYRQALQEISLQAATSAGLLLRIQCLHQLGMHSEVWRWAEEFKFETIGSGKDRNLLLWLSLESALASQGGADVTRFAAQADARAPFFINVMHALARSFAKKGDWATCLSVLERAAQFKPLTPADAAIAQRMQLLIAQAYFEAGSYEKSLHLFFALLNNEQYFEEALYGIIWCYISLGRYDDAELSLRKLVNQSPHSARAADAALIMARRYLNKAQYEWRRATHLASEERRLAAFAEKMHLQAASADASERAPDANRQIAAMLERVRSEKRAGYDDIAALYSRANDICAFIQQHYKTGSYQEISFSRKREQMLHRLDSLMLQIRSGQFSPARKSIALSALQRTRAQVKDAVGRSRLLQAETDINRYRWEREYIDWRKERNAFLRSEARRHAAQAGDSAAVRCALAEATLDREMDSLVQAGERLKSRWRGPLIAECTVAANAAKDADNAAYFLYHLGELYYEQENDDYAKAFARYEQALAAYEKRLEEYRNGAPIAEPEEPARPSLDHSRSIVYFRKAIGLSSSPELTPAALYSLAWCFNDAGQIDSAIERMQRITSGYPQSPYAPQAWMYIGEIAFDKSMLQKAHEAYQMVMSYPESQWFDEALYKYAWTQYRLSNPEKAISSFLALVDLGAKASAGKSLLEKESMDYIAISFSESDATGQKGLARAAMFVDRFGDSDKGMQILHRLATVYRDQGRIDMAERTFTTLLRKFPQHPKAPFAERELLALRERRDGTARVLDDKQEFFRKYHAGGTWARAQTDSAARAQADSLAESVFYDAGISHHQLALQSNDAAAYAAAARTYSQYIKAYPTSPRANECHYNLAEIMFSMGNYYRAAEEYMTVSKRYPNSKYRETAAWNAIVACQNLLKKEEAKNQ